MGNAKYSDVDKATALAVLDANGGNVKKTATDTGIPRNTLAEWAKGRVSDEVPGIRHETRLELAALIDAELNAIFAEMNNKRELATYKDLATAAGIFTDKKQLLEGKATARVESRDLSKLSDDELERLARGEGGG